MKRWHLVAIGLAVFPGLFVLAMIIGGVLGNQAMRHGWDNYDVRRWGMFAAGILAWSWVINRWPAKR